VKEREKKEWILGGDYELKQKPNNTKSMPNIQPEKQRLFFKQCVANREGDVSGLQQLTGDNAYVIVLQQHDTVCEVKCNSVFGGKR